jgi:hypothetical protein
MLTPWEEQQIRAKDRAAMHFLIDSVVLGAFKKWEGELEQDVKAGRPPRYKQEGCCKSS